MDTGKLRRLTLVAGQGEGQPMLRGLFLILLKEGLLGLLA